MNYIKAIIYNKVERDDKMTKIEPRTLAGFMELLPNEQILFCG